MGALRLIRVADVTLEVALRQNDVRGRGGISSAGALSGGIILCLSTLHLSGAADITLEALLRQKNERKRGGICSSGAPLSAEGRHHPICWLDE